MGMVKAGTRHRLRRAGIFAVPILLFITLVSWAFASPVGSSPDDNFHLPSIWCGLGDRDGVCEDSGDAETRLVPESVATAACYAFHAAESAACWNPSETDMTEAAWMNAVGLYPPLFYTTMGLFVGEDVQTSVLTMRVVNSLLIVGLLTGVFFALPGRVRPALLVSTLAAAVPLGLFVIASTNPSSWAFASAATVWVCLYGATRVTGRRQLLLCGLAIVGTVMGAGARADAAIYAVFGVILAAVLGARRGRSMIVPGIAAGLVILISLAFYLTAGQSGTVVSGLPNENPPLTGGQLFANLLGVPSLWWGAFGGNGLGWLDTVPPMMVPVLAFGVFAAAIFIGIHHLTVRRGIAVAMAFGALWLVPFVLLYQSRAVVGTEVQSRYLLPLIIVLLGVASLMRRADREWGGPRLLVAGLSLTAAMSLALHFNIRRYTVGAESAAIDPGAGAEWWWTGVPSPMAVWIIGSLSFAGVFVVLWLLTHRETQLDGLSAVGAPSTDTPALQHAEADEAASTSSAGETTAAKSVT